MKKEVVKKMFKRLFHRHTWKPLKVMYRYREYRSGRQIAVKRCQCVGCGKIVYLHFDGKNILH